MFSRIPSLPALRTFEAAARRGSFKAAAEELYVSPTAVSHQVRTLEEQLGVALFIRKTRAIELTETGDRLARAANTALNALLDAVNTVRTEASVIRVTTIPAFATLRLATAVTHFEKQFPHLSVQIEMGMATVDLRRDRQYDVAIRYGTGPYADLHEVLLLEETFGVYCAPSYASTLSDLAQATMIETAWQETGLPPITWSKWFQAAGQAVPDIQPLQFQEELFVIQSAIAGQGVALISDVLVEDYLKRNLLVSVRPDVTIPGLGYRAVCLPERAETPKVHRFLTWLEDALRSP